jgi:DNA-binding CsgD family transcriptional regulator
MGDPRLAQPRLAHQVRSAVRQGVLGMLSGSGNVKTLEILGEPGMGKTRLLSDLSAEAERRGWRVCYVRCAERDLNTSLYAIRQALDSVVIDNVCQDLPPETSTVIRSVWQASREPQSIGITHVEMAVRRLLEHLARQGLVLIFDDFHWADSHSVAVVEHLIGSPPPTDLLLAVAHRPRQASQWLRGALAHGVELGMVRRVELGPLSLEESAVLLGQQEPDEWSRALYRDSEGIPLYLLASAHAQLVRESPTMVEGELELPRQFSALLAGELALLESDETVVLQAAAVLGCTFETTVVADVAGMNRADTIEAIAGLMRRDVLRGTAGQATLKFRHRLLRDVVYANMDPTCRAKAHRKALAVLAEHGATAAEQAVHIERSAHHYDYADLKVLTRAAEEALPTQPAAAAHWLEIALCGPVAEEERAALSLMLARALSATGRLLESRDLLYEIIRPGVVVPDAVRAPAVRLCAMVECLLGKHADASTLLTVELAALQADPSPELVGFLVQSGVAGLTTGQLPSQEDAELALATAMQDGCQVTVSGALALRALCAASNSDITTAKSALDSCVPVLDQLADEDIAAHPEHLVLVGWAELLLDRSAEAERHLLRGIALSKAAGHQLILPVLYIGLSIHYHCIGRVVAARRAAEDAAKSAGAINAQQLRDIAIALESQGTILSTSKDDGRELVEQAVSALPSGQHWLSVNAATFLAAAGELESDLRRCITLIINTGGGRDLPELPLIVRPRCYEMLTVAAVSRGEPIAADWASRAVAAAAELGLPCQRAYGLLARAHVVRSQGDSAAAAVLYREGACLFRTAGMIGAQARAFTLAAECAADAGSVAEAESMLTLAKALARQCGAAKLYEEADAQQRRLKLPAAQLPKLPEQWRPDIDLAVLTEREREVAGIAATGKSTREIAEILALSPRTVDVHLGRIYRKLNVGSRAALVRLLATIS